MAGGAMQHMVSSFKRNRSLLRATSSKKKRILSTVGKAESKTKSSFSKTIPSRISFLLESRKEGQKHKIVLLLIIFIVFSIVLAITLNDN
ncbi:hypothetical protein HNS38_17760 [Lentimicrobium sp. L6]|uniref:hypothetical protein n=1 Tax=Lentimicrobium sp. L6 TaxID=2735916 RepID=UPI0015547610|nr:hypothetical protein [Lentimicrobium sp. L6]NPD86620.1 hypothetical protein [Lentimicrobium sp. L6]